MKKIFLFFFSLCLLSIAYCQLPDYWQQQVNYTIDVTLNDQANTLDAFEKITYYNNSPDTLTYIWFHIWPNAYKNDRTAFSDQMLENGSTRFYFSSKEERGYINRLDFKVNGINAKTADHPQYIDVIKLLLPAPLPPAQHITITTPFHVKLPYNFSRGGYDKQLYHVTQWYPKPAVYDREGWHPMPYLDQGEFYSEFGNYDVRITVPKEYVVAATGILQNEEEKNWMLQRSPESLVRRSEATSTNGKPKKAAPVKKAEVPITKQPASPLITETKTLRYVQDNVHDFALFASKDFIVKHDTCRLVSGKIVDVYAFYKPEEERYWRNVPSYAKDALQTRSAWIGDYPYQTVSVVQGGGDYSGGMEYPTITAITPFRIPQLLDEVVEHEIGHNWFYGALATNERQHPWMDEGMNSYYDFRYLHAKYGKGNGFEVAGGVVSIKNLERLLFRTYAAQNKDQPIETPSNQFSSFNYNMVAYYKTAQWLSLLEKTLGTEIFDAAMQYYYQQWKMKHPYPEDFKKAMEQVSGKDLTPLFSLVHKKGMLQIEDAKDWKVATPLLVKTITGYVQHPSKNLLLISPGVGYNQYDKIMLGGMITNYKLPPSPFQILAIPLYGTRSRQWNGLGKTNYTFYPEKGIGSAEVFLNASTFSTNEVFDTAGKKKTYRFRKIVPGVKINFREKNPRSTITKYLQWKTFFIHESSPLFSTDSIFTGADTAIIHSIKTQQKHYYINQLQAVYENTRVLYPFRVQLQLEQHQDFLRPTLTTNYFFNYAKEGGLDVRFFAGKFIYLQTRTQKKQFETDRFHLNMTGPTGYEDYTYSNYFIGRNKFEGTASQQIMIRDGGFKVRTNLLANKIGKTDNWLLAANFSSTVPKKLNPLSVLPVKIPLKLFADVGTYADAWQQDSDTDRFLFNAGLHIPLIYEAVNIYIPVLYNNSYKEYLQSVFVKKTRFWKTISFSIDVDRLHKIIIKNL
ncbi:MAG: M1 family metallopeptidase [Flavisolibacter sp.]|nr:M1 family metallopeptidase [Flavisolibacter sp.]